MRINIISSGRFHVLDLARELAEWGHEVRFYSYVPTWRTRYFGLPPSSHRGLFFLLFPLVFLAHKGPEAWRNIANKWLIWSIDHLTACIMEPCDVLIGMSGLCVVSAKTARRKFGAKILIERGSRHINSQKEILETISGARNPVISDYNIQRELQGYQIADLIVIPSHHVEESFVTKDIPLRKLFKNPYGVDLTMFPITLKPSNAVPVVLMVGAWSLRKGCDVLWQACINANSWKILHIGPIGDAVIPRSTFITHHDPVPQWQLVDYFKQADIFVLASREEGLSLVQAQALACGLPLVCTDRTGGKDLQDLLTDPRWITVVPNEDATALQIAIENALLLAKNQVGERDILGAARNQLSWGAYGARYHQKLVSVLKDTNKF